jgi:hypothetical protein
MKFMTRARVRLEREIAAAVQLRGTRLRRIAGVRVFRFAYLRAVAMLVNTVFNDEPSVPTTVMIATEMPAAMRPYSMAVAPDSFRRKEDIRFFMARSLSLCT